MDAFLPSGFVGLDAELKRESLRGGRPDRHGGGGDHPPNLVRGPPIWLIFLAGAFAMVSVGALTVAGAGNAISTNLLILAFLFALFIFAAGLEQAGALDHLARWIVGRAHRPSDLPMVLFISVGLVSAFDVSDALVLVGVPPLFAAAKRLQVSAEPLLLTLAFSVTV